jgi:hypothetical protein
MSILARQTLREDLSVDHASAKMLRQIADAIDKGAQE